MSTQSFSPGRTVAPFCVAKTFTNPAVGARTDSRMRGSRIPGAVTCHEMGRIAIIRGTMVARPIATRRLRVRRPGVSFCQSRDSRRQTGGFHVRSRRGQVFQ